MPDRAAEFHVGKLQDLLHRIAFGGRYPPPADPVAEFPQAAQWHQTGTNPGIRQGCPS
jgi:hypothetical protein